MSNPIIAQGLMRQKVNLNIVQNNIYADVQELRDVIFMLEHRSREDDTTDEDAIIARLSQIKDTLWFNAINLRDTIEEIGREIRERFFSFSNTGGITEITQDNFKQLFPEISDQ